MDQGGHDPELKGYATVPTLPLLSAKDIDRRSRPVAIASLIGFFVCFVLRFPLGPEESFPGLLGLFLGPIMGFILPWSSVPFFIWSVAAALKGRSGVPGAVLSALAMLTYGFVVPDLTLQNYLLEGFVVWSVTVAVNLLRAIWVEVALGRLPAEARSQRRPLEGYVDYPRLGEEPKREA